LTYNEPKKRKLNKLEKVKQNLFKYPQNNINELFTSLIKAFENDDIIYAMKYLCVYRDDELETLITSLEDNYSRTGNYFSETDKNQIIKNFNEILENLNDDALTKIDAQHFELKVSNKSSNLFIADGKWKFQAITTK
jgi:RNA processing factor Prp31